MLLSKAYIEKILKTLPISYYIGKKVSVKLTNEETSAYYFFTDEIHIAYRNITKAVQNTENFCIEELETIIRTLLYHECAHALMTPFKIEDYTSEIPEWEEVFNIMEDARIESFGEYVFENVDFRGLVKKLNPSSAHYEQNALSEWFDIVRLHKKSPFAEDIECLANTWFMGSSPESDYIWIKLHCEKIKEIYLKVKEYVQTPEYLNNNFNLKEDGTFDTVEFEDTTHALAVPLENSMRDWGRRGVKFGKSNYMLSLFERLQEYDNSKYLAELSSFLRAHDRTLGTKAQGQCAYSGVFNPRLTTREDYKFFNVPTKEGHYSVFNKKQLNIFVDTSGSMWEIIKYINMYIKAIVDICKRFENFDLNICTLEEYEELYNYKEFRGLWTRSGENTLTSNIFNIMKRVNPPFTLVQNIVILGGDVFSKGGNTSNFRVFNSSNTHIISDISNKYYMKKYAPCAHHTIVPDVFYSGPYTDAMTKVLKSIFR